MRQASMPPQRDLLRESPENVAAAYLVAAEVAEHDPYWPPKARKERAEHYRREAERLRSAAHNVEVQR